MAFYKDVIYADLTNVISKIYYKILNNSSLDLDVSDKSSLNQIVSDIEKSKSLLNNNKLILGRPPTVITMPLAHGFLHVL